MDQFFEFHKSCELLLFSELRYGINESSTAHQKSVDMTELPILTNSVTLFLPFFKSSNLPSKPVRLKIMNRRKIMAHSNSSNNLRLQYLHHWCCFCPSWLTFKENFSDLIRHSILISIPLQISQENLYKTIYILVYAVFDTIVDTLLVNSSFLKKCFHFNIFELRFYCWKLCAKKPFSQYKNYNHYNKVSKDNKKLWWA